MSQVSVESIEVQGNLSNFRFGDETASNLKNQFFSTFSQIFTNAQYEDEIYGIAWMEDLPIRMDKSGSPEFIPSDFGIVSSDVTFLEQALSIFQNYSFKGSLETLRIIRSQLQYDINSKIDRYLKSIHVDSRIEVGVLFDLNLNFEVLNHPKKLQIRRLLLSDISLANEIKSLCVLSQFLISTRGVADFRQLYKLAPQRAVDMFAQFLRELSKNEFKFKILNDEISWFFEEDFWESEESCE